MKNQLLILAVALSALGSQAALAQAEPTALASVAGAPFSGVRSQQSARNFVDGNRIDRGGSVRLFRDGLGRTRVERETPAEVLAANPRMEPVQITINDAVSGERYVLHPQTKTAMVFKGGAPHAMPLASQPPDLFVTFARHLFGANDPGWSKPVSLGEKSIDGVRAVGSRSQYTIPIGLIDNEKPILLTVEQWFSPELGMLVQKSARASLGGEFRFEVENIVKGEPDPALFSIPADYSRAEVGNISAAAH